MSGMLRVGERRLVMLTMLQMESKLDKGDDPFLSDKVWTSPLLVDSVVSLIVYGKIYQVNIVVSVFLCEYWGSVKWVSLW